jgi:hypothetical protein
MNDDDANPIKLRRAPNGKIFALCRREPVATAEGRLRYFSSERDAWAFIAEKGVEDRSNVFA